MADALRHQVDELVQPDGMADAQPPLPAVGVQLAAEVASLAVGALAHGGAAVGALHQPGQQVGLACTICPGAQPQAPLNRLKGCSVNDGLVGALHPVPLVFRGVDDGLGFVAHLFPAALDHHPSVHLVGEDAAHRHLVPQAEVVFHGVIAGPAPLGLIPGGVGDALLVQQIGNILAAVAFQGPLVDFPYHLRRLGIRDNVVFVCRVLSVAVDGKAADVFALFPLQVEHHADVFRQVLQIPLVHQTVDLPGLLVPLHLRVGVVGYGDEPDAPNGKQTVDVLLNQFHVPGEAGLALAQDDLEFLCFGGLNHTVEVRAVAVDSGKILITKNRVDIPPVVNGIAGQQGLLVLDALRLGLMLVFILLTQSCIDRAKDLLHLLQGVTARYHHTL